MMELYLGSRNLTDDNIDDLCKTLSINNAITTIYLANNKIGDSGAIKLAALLTNNKSIISFNIDSNNIGNIGAKAFAEMLRKNKILLSLNIASNKIGQMGLKDVAEALMENTTLQSLNLAGNTIEDVGRNSLIEALIVNYTLTEIALEEDGYLDDVVYSLIRRNNILMRQRRGQFIHAIVALAADAINPDSKSFWSRLPNDLKLHIFSFLNFTGVDNIGKNSIQIYTCAKFIFDNIKALRFGLRRGCSFKIYEQYRQTLNSPSRFNLTFFYKSVKEYGKQNDFIANEKEILGFKLISIITYAHVLLKKDRIISLAKQFGFTEAVKIHYDLPYEGEDKIRLRFIVTQARDDLSYKNHTWLAGKLSAELDCDVSVVVQESIDNLYIYDYERKSALVTDESALKKVIYKIKNGIAKEDDADINEVDLINFDEIECKKIEGEYDESLQRGLLKQVNEYLTTIQGEQRSAQASRPR